MRQNIGNAANELMWGVPGTLLAARVLYARTREERWRAAVEESERALRDERGDDGVWTQVLYGRPARYLGPIHGFVGNIAALGDPSGAADVLARTAIVEDGRVNWPPGLGSEGAPRLQWCHGAPGIIATAGEYLDEDLLLGGAELIWEAGPPHAVEKGAGLCHGTAGNGYALLKRSSARATSSGSSEPAPSRCTRSRRSRSYRARYSLFTGGIGAAIYAADCLDARARFPIVDGVDNT